jgi:uncharacterized membrane protein YozB (DUF420 family)
MMNILTLPGFLGTRATFLSDLSFVLILISSILFTIGWQLARHKHYAHHRWVQTLSVILNSSVVLSFMIRSFIIHILPGIPAKLKQGDYAVSTVHAIVGTIGLLLGLFVMLRGNELVPKTLRFKNYKRFMRTSYAFYMIATLLGIVEYTFVYILGI